MFLLFFIWCWKITNIHNLYQDEWKWIRNVVFQHRAILMWQLLYNMLLWWIVCLQINRSWARFPTSNMSFILNGNMFSKCIHYFNYCLTTHNMLLIIINISSTIMTYVFLKHFITFLSLRRMDKYLHVGIWNALCIIMIMELKWNVIAPMVVDSNAFFPNNWKCCVMYFIKKDVLSLPTTTMTICKPCEF